MDLELNAGLMDLFKKENGKKTIDMVKENLFGLMDLNKKEIFMKTLNKAMESLFGQKANTTKKGHGTRI